MTQAFDRGVLVGVGLLFLLVIGGRTFTYISTLQLDEDAGWVAHTHEVLDLTGDVMLSLVDAETGARGFLVAGEEEFLSPYDAALRQLDTRLASLKDTTRDNPRQQARIAQLEDVVGQVLSIMKRAIALRREQAGPTAFAAILTQGKERMDTVRRLMAEMEQEEHELLAQREQRSRSTYRVAVAGSLCAGMLGLMALGLLLWLFRRSVSARERALDALRASQVRVQELNATLEQQVQDRTRALQESKRRLRESEQWLAATLGSIGDGVIATDAQGRVRFLNAVAQQLTGWTQADALGKDVVDVFTIVEQRTRRPIPNPARAAVERGEPVTFTKQPLLIHQDGSECPIDDSAAPIRDATGAVIGAVLIFRDISDRCRLEEHLRQSQKMEAIGRLAGGIAHDFNNIMTVITGYSDVLLEKPQGDGHQQEFLRQINSAGKRAAALTQQILAFSCKQMLVPDVLSLNRIVRDVAAIVRRIVGDQVEVVTDLAADLGMVKTDPTQMGQVILNLAMNARDAMPDGGKLTIATANAEVRGYLPGAESPMAPGRYAVLSVADTGCGMSQAVLSHIFEPFFTTKELGKGTGMGLAAVYGIVKQSGGHIELSSQVGAGTTFRIYLPQVEERRPEATPAARQALTVHETILLVDDEDAVRRMTKIMLERCGYHLLEAGNGRDAEDLSARYEGSIDLLISDVVMPDLSGPTVAQRLVSQRPSLRVLFLSGYTEDRMLDEKTGAASADFLHKPFTIDELSRKVRDVLDRR